MSREELDQMIETYLSETTGRYEHPEVTDEDFVSLGHIIAALTALKYSPNQDGGYIPIGVRLIDKGFGYLPFFRVVPHYVEAGENEDILSQADHIVHYNLNVAHNDLMDFIHYKQYLAKA